ncbi:hypothetical protein EMIHUDRAFT_204636 [Emiliania huxleyi CCMP1516]|uniref:SWIRM domain-containing protein n=2 Tax=Emiliania huxleyi TaxID=2903 RepID=A0A0D3JW19_EMIH1|nr:hypothetical protein EMIHUDRAFT_204636 [Emiliania huxleyi CCMP1516]EOD27704.1 hypothetical protein EMIHUDRAFT_204636 [Emiliania huxleyi CCMP1516]|eukprot:XP_005780133.1 hypothetical protein EMIHUDRAFT_204636 [Emiliania huxleyi CCMP1516]
MAPAAAPPGPPAVILPSYAAWFDPNAVHAIERRALPEFFDGSSAVKTELAYTEARNFIVSSYREQPALYLPLTEVRRHLAIDVAAATRLHRFLEHWGIINYSRHTLSARPETFPSGGGSGWSDDDTLALLEALGRVGEGRWEEVAAHVGKSVDECVQRFVELPIEEPHGFEALRAPPNMVAITLAPSPAVKAEEAPDVKMHEAHNGSGQ